MANANCLGKFMPRGRKLTTNVYLFSETHWGKYVVVTFVFKITIVSPTISAREKS